MFLVSVDEGFQSVPKPKADESHIVPDGVLKKPYQRLRADNVVL